jgi:hypothetical protein
MLQPTALNRWSQVTIYSKPSTYSIGLALEGGWHACKHLQGRVSKPRYRRAELMPMTKPLC